MQSWVVSCFPVPKDTPGSISIKILSSSSTFNSSQVGLIKILSMVNDLKNSYEKKAGTINELYLEIRQIKHLVV